MTQKILDNAITGKIWNELVRLGYRCYTGQSLVWNTDKPIHKKSFKPKSNIELTEPYMTSLGYKTACKFYEELKSRKN